MIIGFTGHRDMPATNAQLAEIAAAYPAATWVTGGAIGFDNSVEAYAKNHGIENIVHKPDYSKHGRGATFIRNRLIVDSSDLVVCMYSGKKGGTEYTINYAQKNKKQVINLHDHKITTNKELF